MFWTSLPLVCFSISFTFVSTFFITSNEKCFPSIYMREERGKPNPKTNRPIFLSVNLYLFQQNFNIILNVKMWSLLLPKYIKPTEIIGQNFRCMFLSLHLCSYHIQIVKVNFLKALFSGKMVGPPPERLIVQLIREASIEAIPIQALILPLPIGYRIEILYIEHSF